MKAIPRFSYEETGDIELLLKNQQIPFEMESVFIHEGSFGGTMEYKFRVPQEFYSSTIEVIRKYYGLEQHQENELNLEHCPGCNSKILNPKECSVCGLSFSYDPEEAMGDHPFYIYLKQQNLI